MSKSQEIKIRLAKSEDFEQFCNTRNSENKAQPSLDGSVARYVNIFYRRQIFTHMLP